MDFKKNHIYRILIDTEKRLFTDPLPPTISSTNVLWNDVNFSSGDITFTITFENSQYYVESIDVDGDMAEEVNFIASDDFSLTNQWITNGAIIIEDMGEKGMTLYFFQSNAEKNKVDKLSELNYLGYLTGTLRERSSIINPTITIEYKNFVDLGYEKLPQFNYVFIPSFNRWYFVTEIVFINNNLWSISLSVDVLMSYKDEIKSLNAEIERQENDYNSLLVDDQRLVQDNKEYTYLEDSTHNTIFTKRIDPDTGFFTDENPSDRPYVITYFEGGATIS